MEADSSIPPASPPAPALPPGLKPALFEQFARLGRALSHGQRLELLELLAQCEHPVDTLARTMNLPVANVSQHLQQLKQAGLVRARREGRSVIYRVAGPDVVALLAQLQQVAEGTLTEVTRLVQQLDDRDSVLPMPLEDVLRQARDGLVTLIDVRPPHEFAAAHLPGAINLPLDALAQRLGELPPGREVLAYCRGPYCVMAVEAVARLREAGIPARRIAGGLPHWRLDGASLDGTQPGFAARSGLTSAPDGN